MYITAAIGEVLNAAVIPDDAAAAAAGWRRRTLKNGPTEIRERPRASFSRARRHLYCAYVCAGSMEDKLICFDPPPAERLITPNRLPEFRPADKTE